MRCKADLELRWKSNSWPKDSAGRISWVAALSWGSQIHLHRAPSNLDYKEKKNREILSEQLHANSLLFKRNGFKLTWQPWGETGPPHSPSLVGPPSQSLHPLCTPEPSPSLEWWSLDVPLNQPYPVGTWRSLLRSFAKNLNGPKHTFPKCMYMYFGAFKLKRFPFLILYSWVQLHFFKQTVQLWGEGLCVFHLLICTVLVWSVKCLRTKSRDAQARSVTLMPSAGLSPSNIICMALFYVTRRYTPTVLGYVTRLSLFIIYCCYHGWGKQQTVAVLVSGMKTILQLYSGRLIHNACFWHFFPNYKIYSSFA